MSLCQVEHNFLLVFKSSFDLIVSYRLTCSCGYCRYLPMKGCPKKPCLRELSSLIQEHINQEKENTLFTLNFSSICWYINPTTIPLNDSKYICNRCKQLRW